MQYHCGTVNFISEDGLRRVQNNLKMEQFSVSMYFYVLKIFFKKLIYYYNNMCFSKSNIKGTNEI